MVTVRAISGLSDGFISFLCTDMEFAGELMSIMAEAATEPIAFTVVFDDVKKKEQSRFIDPEGGTDEQRK